MSSNNNQLLKSLLSEIDPLEQSKVDTKMDVAARIATAMDSKGWNNQDLQKVMGASPLQIRKWLSGTYNFTLDSLVQLEEVLDVKLLNKSL
ncbi:helix-turn-helix domain-containing protein [Algoriphagus sp. D3-2-R+10]|uniref:helix-turn-helix domain-containing protein n=1 Tax=Algoriphagus aurantiacus TaxID=3103948 RepID=UPI002B3C0957|nr:helix-turn-helix domain-containing protein [Algoriphagus sp. D3-2-R+10]MEB2774991.1 helix-turn-helix domain-containing protein [Algoriphagus sp. D3-2-R+10]